MRLTKMLERIKIEEFNKRLVWKQQPWLHFALLWIYSLIVTMMQKQKQVLLTSFLFCATTRLFECLIQFCRGENKVNLRSTWSRHHNRIDIPNIVFLLLLVGREILRVNCLLFSKFFENWHFSDGILRIRLPILNRWLVYYLSIFSMRWITIAPDWRTKCMTSQYDFISTGVIVFCFKLKLSTRTCWKRAYKPNKFPLWYRDWAAISYFILTTNSIKRSAKKCHWGRSFFYVNDHILLIDSYIFFYFVGIICR